MLGVVDFAWTRRPPSEVGSRIAESVGSRLGANGAVASITQGSRLVAACLIITLTNFSTSSDSCPNSCAADAYSGSYKPAPLVLFLACLGRQESGEAVARHEEIPGMILRAFQLTLKMGSDKTIPKARSKYQRKASVTISSRPRWKTQQILEAVAPTRAPGFALSRTRTHRRHQCENRLKNLLTTVVLRIPGQLH
jgi:hypothetical protein